MENDSALSEIFQNGDVLVTRASERIVRRKEKSLREKIKIKRV